MAQVFPRITTEPERTPAGHHRASGRPGVLAFALKLTAMVKLLVEVKVLRSFARWLPVNHLDLARISPRYDGLQFLQDLSLCLGYRLE